LKTPVLAQLLLLAVGGALAGCGTTQALKSQTAGTTADTTADTTASARGDTRAPAVRGDSGPMTVLLIGNSQLGFRPPDVALAVEALAVADLGFPRSLVVHTAQVMGEGCPGFVAAGTGPQTPQGRAGSGDYDVVLLWPAITETTRADPCWDTFRALAEKSGARFGVVATAHIASQHPEGFGRLHDAVDGYARDHGLLFVPAGRAWLLLLGPDPTPGALLSLYGADQAHPGAKGSYLYALAVYGALTGRPVLGLPSDLPPLRCDPNAPCLSHAELVGCVNDDREWQCPPANGAMWDGQRPQRPTIPTGAEAAAMQAAVAAALAGR
jgi:hypothetical protein